MRIDRMMALSGGLLVVASLGQLHDVEAADYPDQAVRIIVNVSPGGGVDTTTRIVAQKLEQKLGQTMVIENKPSASGNTGAASVFHAPPDGYMLLSSSGSPLTLNGWIFKSLSYEPTGFEPISIMSRIPNVLVVRKELPAKTVKDLVTYGRAEPGKLTFALARRWYCLSPDRRIVHDEDRSENGPCALQRHDTRIERPDRRYRRPQLPAFAGGI